MSSRPGMPPCFSSSFVSLTCEAAQEGLLHSYDPSSWALRSQMMNRCGVAFQTKKKIRRMRQNEEFGLKFRKKLNLSLKHVLVLAPHTKGSNTLPILLLESQASGWLGKPHSAESGLPSEVQQ